MNTFYCCYVRYVIEGARRKLWDVCVALCSCSRAVCVASQRQGQGSMYY